MPSACKPTLTGPGGRIAMSPRSTTRATDPSRPRCTAWCSNTLRLSHRPKTLPAPICRSLSKTSSTPSWSAASWRTGSCACAAATAATTSWSRSAASAGGVARHTVPGAWTRRSCALWTVCFANYPRIGGKLTARNLAFVDVGLRCFSVFRIRKSVRQTSSVTCRVWGMGSRRFSYDITCKQVSLH